MTETAGVDFSASRPSAAQLVAGGFRFVVGYLKPLRADGTPNPFELRPEDVAGYRAAGLAVLTVWETTQTAALGGGSAGAVDGAAAAVRAAAIGYPSDCPIFAAVDFGATPAQLPTVVAYLEGFHGAVAHPAGAYGSHAVVEAAAAAGIPWRWQTAAWSRDSAGRDQLSSAAHLYQRAAPSGHWPVIPGTDEDVCTAPLPAYGGTLTPGGGAPIPAPSPPAPPVPAPPVPGFDVRGWRANLGDTGAVFAHLQQWGNRCYPSYCRISPTAPSYGPQTAAFLAEFAHRSGIPSADGRNIGPLIAGALYGAGFRG